MSKLAGIDGIDGSGKTTVAQAIAHDTGVKYMYFTEDNILAPLRKQADTLTYEERFAFYLSMNLMNHPRLAMLRQSSTSAIILDRTPLSTFAFHEVMGVNLVPFNSVKDHLLDQFDVLCYFYASSESRKARIISRQGNGDMQKFDEFSLRFQDEIHKAFLAILPDQAIIIDTSNLDINGAVDFTRKALNNREFFESEA